MGASDDAFDRYITSATLDCSDPIAYWNGLETSKTVPLGLARMAKDYLSCPGECLINVCISAK